MKDLVIQTKRWIDSGESIRVADAIERLDASDRARLLDSLNPDERDAVVIALDTVAAAELLDQLPEVFAAELLEHIDAPHAAAIIHELPSDEQADILRIVDPEHAEAILVALEPTEAEQVRRLGGYAPDTAGGIMITEFLSYTDTTTVGETVADMRQNADKYNSFDVQYCYVTDERGVLRGVCRLRDLILASDTTQLEELMQLKLKYVRDDDTLDTLDDFFDSYAYHGVPVVDEQSRLVGVVLGKDVREAESDRAGATYRRSQGIISGEELRSMPLLLRARRRLSWLGINICLNLVSASVIAANQNVLEELIVLAIFLPVISDMSGCQGNQAVAVSVRELTLGVTRPPDLFRVFRKEAFLGLINGIVLGSVVGTIAGLYSGQLYVGIVIASALAANSVFAVCLGGLIPLVLRGIGKDPALASGPILTTLTDMLGFFLTLTLAAALITAG